MRRNRNMGRANGGGSLNLSGGPLLTEHLKDIDLELDLLKRKREMLEQQTKYLQPFNPPPQRNFNQQPFYLLEPKQGGSHRDFSHLYNDGPQQYRKPFGKKRQSDSDWQNQSFPKRSAGHGSRGSNYAGPSHNRSQRPFNPPNPQPKTTPYKHGQGKQSIGQKIAQQGQQKPVKNVVANKIAKPAKVAAPPNKIASKPVAERGTLVATALQSVAEVERNQEALRLVADKVPTKQMAGRLELALGTILREIRDICAESPHSAFLRSFGAQRVMKHAIRERIRTAMLGKIVGKTVEIINEYRNMFPQETDIDIVNKALEMTDELSVASTTQGAGVIVPDNQRPNEYYKIHASDLMNRALHEMFDKIEEIYEKEASEKNVQPVASQEPVKAEATEDNVAAVATQENGDTQENVAATATQENDAVEDSKETGSDEVKDITKENVEVVEKTEETAETADPKDVEATKDGKTEDTGEIADPKGVKAANYDYDAQIDAEFQKKFPLSPNEIRRMMPRLLKRHIATIIRLLNLNSMYKETIADITKTTRAMYVNYKPELADSSDKPATITNPPPAALLYYVKVMGSPELPKRHLMHEFLKVFQPRSIKKHKTVRNLLFIGFSSPRDSEEIVKADGTIIGGMKLNIKMCDNNSGKSDDNADSPMPTTQETAEINQSARKESTSDLDVLGADLDGQITELLTSIRNSEEGKIDNSMEAEASEPSGVPAAEDDKAPNTQDVTDELVKEADQNENTENVAKTEVPENGVKAQLEKPEEENYEQNSDPIEQNSEKTDQVSELKANATGRGTPTRASSRLANAPATPSTIRTRRASRLLQN